MQTVFNEFTRAELIERIHSINENAVGAWGKMTVFQMLKHCTVWDEWILGTHNPTYQQSFLGKLFGKLALKSSVGDDRPMRKNVPAGDLAVKEKTGDVPLQKKKWIMRVKEYEHFSNDAFIHDFFGKMTREQIGILAYKHADHHLRQFGC
jgi:hypothetical protein